MEEDDAPESLLHRARKQYPILNKVDLGFKVTPRNDKGYLEFWPADEPGSPEHPRPREIPTGKVGVEVYDKRTRPIDILGDVVSHHLIEKDKHVKDYYQRFVSSIDDKQHNILREQYEHARKNRGEDRPFDEWKTHSGLPAYFRGHPFKQWDRTEELYSPQQREMLDEMMVYLSTGKKPRKTLMQGQ